MTERVYIAIGSNHRAAENLPRGMTYLTTDERVTVVETSPVYESAAMDRQQDNPHGDTGTYLNAAIALETELTIVELKRLLTVIEDKCGRVRRDAYGEPSEAIALDMDIILFGEREATYDAGDKTRVIPHPDLQTQAHVALPLMQIAPEVEHPQTGETIAEIAARLNTNILIRRDDINLSGNEDNS